MNSLPMTLATALPNEQLYGDYQEGLSFPALSQRYGCSVRTTQDIVRNRRYVEIINLDLEYIPSVEFTMHNAEKRILSRYPDSDPAPRRPKAASEMPSYIASLYDTPLLSPLQERYLFRKYNFLKYRASQLRQTLDPQRPRLATMRRIEHLQAEALTTRNHLIRANLRLVVSIAKRFARSTDSLSELISDGNSSLMRAVEKFDYARGNRFSTYASWAISRSCIRVCHSQQTQAARFHCGQDDLLRATADESLDPRVRESVQRVREQQVERLLERLSQRERGILVRHYGLNFPIPPQGLKEIGESLGISKERARQLKQRALQKLRQLADEDLLECAAV